jgi:hypothetical protein
MGHSLVILPSRILNIMLSAVLPLMMRSVSRVSIQRACYRLYLHMIFKCSLRLHITVSLLPQLRHVQQYTGLKKSPL